MAVRVEQISKVYRGAPALANVDLHLGTGELVALLGPSGSGKTSLLRVIAGLERPDAGRVLFDGQNATHLPVQQRQVGFVFQHYALFKHLRVEDNIAYGLNVRPRATRPPSGDIRRRVGELIDLVQLNGFERRFPAQLSGGQRQRVALARALAVDPKILLLDEPFGALDQQVRRDLRRWLRDIHDRTGHTTLFVTHDQHEALELADRVAVLNKGRIEQAGTPDDIYDQPASAFVAGFIGEAARVRVTVSDGAIRLGAALIPAPSGYAGGSAAELFIRPHDLELAAGGGTLAAQIRGIRRAGPFKRAELLLEGADRPVEIEVPAETTLEQGGRVDVRLKIVRLYPVT